MINKQLLDNKKITHALNYLKIPSGYSLPCLINSSIIWKARSWLKDWPFKFSDVEINEAVNRIDGFLGMKCGIKCYVSKKIPVK